MLHYVPQRIDNTEIFSDEEVRFLDALSSKVDLNELLASPRWREESGIDNCIFTARTEGSTYSAAETIVLIKTGATAGGKPLNDANVIVNAKRSNEMVLENAKHFFLDLAGAAKQLHRVFMAGLLPEAQLGCARKTQNVRIGGTTYTPPNGAPYLEAELARLLKSSESITDPFSKSQYIACNLSYLQFFEDGNKRVSRAMQNIVLLAHDRPPVVMPIDAHTRYLEAQIAYYEQGDYSFHRGLFLDAYKDYYAPTPTPAPAQPGHTG